MPLNNSSGINQVTSANTDISVANGTTAPALTLNSGTGNNQILKLDSSAKIPAVDGSQLTNLSSATDVSYLNQQQLIQQVDILRCLAAASLSISDYSTMFCDIFSDSNGYSNTLDTGNTTAIFDSTNKKYNNGSADVSDSIGETSNTTGADNSWRGWKIHANNTCTLKTITKFSGETSTTAKLQDNSNNDIASATFSGDTATFSSPPTLTTGTDYRIVTGGSGTTMAYKNVAPSLPYNRTNVNFVDGVYDGVVNNTHIRSLVSITTGGSPANSVVQTNTITVSGNLTAYQIYAKKAVAGSGSVQYKISFDNGSSWSSAKELNTKYANSTTGTSIKVQLLLNGSGSGNTAEAENYSMMVWY